MSVELHADRVEIFKFRSTGLVALFEEVMEFIRSGEFERRGLDLDTAMLKATEEDFRVVFFPKPEPETKGWVSDHDM